MDILESNKATISHGQYLAIKWMSYFFGMPTYINYRPRWLGGLELDAYWENIGIGLEFQGDQHYTPTFGERSFQQQIQNDITKRKICIQSKIPLVKIDAVDLTSRKLIRKRIKFAMRSVNFPELDGNYYKKSIGPTIDLENDARTYLNILKDKGCLTTKTRSRRRGNRECIWSANMAGYKNSRIKKVSSTRISELVEMAKEDRLKTHRHRPRIKRTDIEPKETASADRKSWSTPSGFSTKQLLLNAFSEMHMSKR